MRLFALILLFSGCYLDHYPVTPPVAARGVYMLVAGDYQGTAWAVDPHHLVTAGHMCEDPDAHPYITNGVRNFPVSVVEWQDTADDTSDICVLEAPTRVNFTWPIIIADRMPRLGETAHYTGYPLGVWHEGTGKYLGDTDGPNSHSDDYTFDAACDHGASGSPVYTSRGVWGVLVRGRVAGAQDGSDGCTATGRGHIIEILDELGVKYQLTPEAPPAYEPQ